MTPGFAFPVQSLKVFLAPLQSCLGKIDPADHH